MGLKFHTFLADFSGETPDEILHALHEDSRTGKKNPEAWTFEAWWQWQDTILTSRGIETPAPDAENAAAHLLNNLVRVGALDVGHRPPKPSAPPSPSSSTPPTPVGP